MDNTKVKYQVTLTSKSGKYKPVSAIIELVQEDVTKDLTKDAKKKSEIITKGIQKICLKRYWSKSELKNYEYTLVKVRLYDEEKIKAEAKARYALIKERKYQTGEWKRPKND